MHLLACYMASINTYRRLLRSQCRHLQEQTVPKRAIYAASNCQKLSASRYGVTSLKTYIFRTLKYRTALAFRRLERAEADSAITQQRRNYIS